MNVQYQKLLMGVIAALASTSLQASTLAPASFGQEFARYEIEEGQRDRPAPAGSISLASQIASIRPAGQYQQVVDAPLWKQGSNQGEAHTERADTALGNAVPIPGVAWLFGSAMLTLIMSRVKRERRRRITLG